VVRKSCVVMELLRSARPSSGRKADSWQREERELMLRSCDVSSLVVNILSDQART